MQVEAIVIFLGLAIIGVPLLLFRLILSGQKVKLLRKKIENCEYISPEEFALWREKDAYPIYQTYEEYLQTHNTPPEEREKCKKAVEKYLDSPEGKKFLDELGLFGKKRANKKV